ncbi:MAG: lipase [Streptosporangiales bacterium]|nr:lipase [Streptosporangiales bacterium]
MKPSQRILRTRRPRTRIAACACALLLAALPVGSAAASPHTGTTTSSKVATPDRGDLVSATPLHTWSAREAARYLTKADFDSSMVKHGVRTYRIVYRTVDAARRPTTASGLLVLPRIGDRRLRVVSYGHGTSVHRADVPSTPDGFAASPGVLYGAAGFASVSPDYLGLGSGPGTHPWMHVRTEASASLDLLRAAREFTARTDRTLDRDVLVTGFSQGASAALGLARELQRRADPWFRLGALASISGAYALRDAEIPALLAGEVQQPYGVVYASYLFVAWNRLFHLYRDPSEVFQQPYADKVEKLFDGSTPGEEIVAALPNDLDKLLTERGFELLRKPTGQMAVGLRQADSVCEWAPRTPLRLYRATGDEQAVTANTDHCRSSLLRHGVRAPIVELGEPEYQGSRHLGSAVAGVTATARWFQQL